MLRHLSSESSIHIFMVRVKQMFVICGSIAIGQKHHATRKLCSHVAISLSIAALPSLVGFHLPTGPNSRSHCCPKVWHGINILWVTAIEGEAESRRCDGDKRCDSNWQCRQLFKYPVLLNTLQWVAWLWRSCWIELCCSYSLLQGILQSGRVAKSQQQLQHMLLSYMLLSRCMQQRLSLISISIARVDAIRSRLQSSQVSVLSSLFAVLSSQFPVLAARVVYR